MFGARLIKYWMVASASRVTTAITPSQLEIAKGNPKNLLCEIVGIIAVKPRRGYRAAISEKHIASKQITEAPIIHESIDAGPATSAHLNAAKNQPLPIIADTPINVADNNPNVLLLPTSGPVN